VHWNVTIKFLSEVLLTDDHRLGAMPENQTKPDNVAGILTSYLRFILEVEGAARQSNAGMGVVLDKKQPMVTWSIDIVCET
jgi:hypothetical protein